MKVTHSLFLTAVFFLSLQRPLAAAISHSSIPHHPIDSDLGGPRTRYTDLLVDIARRWPPKHVDYRDRGVGPVRLRCIETPGAEFYIGLEQVMHVAAPLEAVDAVLADIDGYRRLFPGFEHIAVESKDGNRWLTSWEQSVPLFFVPNVKYRMTYLVDRSRPGRALYRYQLKDSNRVKKSDGLIVVETEEGGTRYTEFDFFDTDYGILTTLAPGRIWRDSVETFFLSDVAIKLRAEHSDWDDAHVRAEAKKLLELYPLDETLRTRSRFPRWEEASVPVAGR